MIEIRIGRVVYNVDLSFILCLNQRLFAPSARDDVAGFLADTFRQVGWDHAELQCRPALQEQNGVVVVNIEQRTN